MDVTQLRLLHLEDDRVDAALVLDMLARDGIVCEVVRVETRAEYCEQLAAHAFDLILSDDTLPSFDGASAFTLARERRPDTPFIFVSGTLGEEIAIERLKAGATDCVLKQRLGRLPSSIRRALSEAANRAERARAEAEVRRLNDELEERVAARTMALEAANEALARSEQRLRAVLDNSPEVITLKDRDGRYLLVNREFERRFGRTASAVIGKTDHDLFPLSLAGLYRASDLRALATHGPIAVEEPGPPTGGADRVYASSKFPLIDAAGSIHGICAISTDITARTLADEEIKAARREAERANRAKSEFLSRMSHDLRTPLNAILGFAQLLEADADTPPQLENAQQILKGGKHLLELINEVLDISRIEAGHLSLSPEPVTVRDLAQHAMELVAPLARRRRITMALDEIHGGAQAVMADRQRLNQVLLNLLSNAVKYNRPGGHVGLAWSEVVPGRLRIAVQDTGVGIPADKLRLLFTPFERLGVEGSGIEGTGLGLALSRALAEAMGGSLGVSSELDHGSTFWIDLPMASEAPPAAVREALEQGSGSPACRGTVLYVEDNTSNVRLMERVLERRPGVALRHAPNGAAAVALARTARPDLVLLDLHLPDMSGEEVLRQLWEDIDLRRIPVAVLSADATPGQTRRLLAAGAIAYLTKPLNIAQVLRLVDDLLAPRQGERPPAEY